MKWKRNLLPFFILCMQFAEATAQQDTVFINETGAVTLREQANYYRIISPSDSAAIELREYFINDTLRSITHYTNKLATVKEGAVVQYNADGALAFRGSYRKGFQTGVWIYYSEKGRKISERRLYTDPLKSYYSIRYDSYTWGKHNEGKIDEYERKTGSWKEYHTNSDSVKLLSTYVNGMRDGEQLEFYLNGKLKRRELILNKKTKESEQYDTQGKRVKYFPAFTYPKPPYPVKRALSGIDCVDSLLKRMDVRYAVRVHKDGSISGIEITGPVSSECTIKVTAAIQKMKRWKPAKYEHEPIDYTFEGVVRYYGPRE